MPRIHHEPNLAAAKKSAWDTAVTAFNALGHPIGGMEAGDQHLVQEAFDIMFKGLNTLLDNAMYTVLTDKKIVALNKFSATHDSRIITGGDILYDACSDAIDAYRLKDGPKRGR